MKDVLLLSYDCHNKGGWLKTNKICHLKIPESININQGVSWVAVPLEALGENPSLPLPASHDGLCSLASLTCDHITLICHCVHFAFPLYACFLCVSCKDTYNV